MGTIQQGAKQAVVNCMRIKPRDNVVIVTDRQALKISHALMKEAEKITKKVAVFILEDFGKRPLTKLPREIANSVKQSTAVFYTADSQKGEKNALRIPIIKLATKRGRQAHMPNIDSRLMREGMCADYRLIQKVSKRVYDIVRKAKKITVTTKAGTNLLAEFSPKIKWIICDGNITKSKQKWSNLPDGEVFTCVKNINGTAVIDGSIGAHLGIRYGLLNKTPIYMQIKNGKVAQLKCKNKKLEAELKGYMKQDKNASRIGEFALGTNTALKRFTGNLLQDEKFPSVHVAIGSGYPESTGAKWDSKAHCDMIMAKTTVIADNKEIMREGKYIKSIAR